MKLYRGLKTSEHLLFDDNVEKRISDGWKKILSRRSSNDFEYPEDLNDVIIDLYKSYRVSYAHFTDNEKIAKEYARKEKGLLIQIDISMKDLLEYFIIEFQNYTKRREQFELTYMIRGRDLYENRKKWKLKEIKF